MKFFCRRDENDESNRRGAVMIIALIALVLCSAASLSMFRTTTLRQKRFELRHNQIQAQLLADSAIDRAARQLALDPTFRDESWEIECDGNQGSVAITLDEKTNKEFDLKIQATYPIETSRRVQVSIETVMTSPAENQSEPADGEEQTP